MLDLARDRLLGKAETQARDRQGADQDIVLTKDRRSDGRAIRARFTVRDRIAVSSNPVEFRPRRTVVDRPDDGARRAAAERTHHAGHHPVERRVMGIKTEDDKPARPAPPGETAGTERKEE